jgi:hypothetical protein
MDRTLSVLDIEHFPNHKKKSANEWSSSCPICPSGDGYNVDRFIFTVDKAAYWCRQCGFGGYVGNGNGSTITLTDDQRADIERQARQVRQKELDSQRTILQTLQAKRNDLVYHRNLKGNTGYVERKWGLEEETIEWFRVGYCHACPEATYSDSITIPYYEDQALINIRHRLSSPNGDGKYRPEVVGLPNSIFNIDSLDDGWVILVEGEFKAMVLWQFGFPTVGIPGTTFKPEWVKLFLNVDLVYIATDPDPAGKKAALKAGKLLRDSGIDSRIVSVPTKPDDYFVVDGGTAAGFSRLLEDARTYEAMLRGDTSLWTRRYKGAFGKLRS